MSRAVVLGVRGAAALTIATGVVMQFVQRTDPRHPLLYFTVDSAVLAVVTLLAALAMPTGGLLARIRPGVCASALLSGLVYAAVIAPAQNGGSWFAPHDDIPVRIAQVLLHGVGPALLLLDFVLDPPRSTQSCRVATWWLLWPAGYFASVEVLAATGLGEMPYEFLDWRIVGLWALPTLVVVGAVFWAGVWGLALLGNALDRGRRVKPTLAASE